MTAGRDFGDENDAKSIDDLEISVRTWRKLRDLEILTTAEIATLALVGRDEKVLGKRIARELRAAMK